MKAVKDVEITYRSKLFPDAINETIKFSNGGRLEFKSEFDYLAMEPLGYHHNLNGEEFEKMSKITLDYLDVAESHMPSQIKETIDNSSYEIKVSFTDETLRHYKGFVDNDNDCFIQFRHAFLSTLNIQISPLLFDTEEDL